jgi:hypothetical protein
MSIFATIPGLWGETRHGTTPTRRRKEMATVKTATRLLGRQAAADYLGINLRSLERLVGAKRLAPVRLPGVRRTLFERGDLDRLVAEGKGQAR